MVLILLYKTSTAQAIKSFECQKSYEDSFSSVYSVRIRLDKQLDEKSRVEIVKDALKKRFQIPIDKILKIDALGSKKYKTYQYKVRVAKNK